MGAPTILEISTNCMAAAKKGNRWFYVNNYAGGPKTISCREPGEHQIHLTHVYSWQYAAQVGCSTKTALGHLRKLVAAGVLTERKESTVVVFSPLREDAIALGREIIAELVEEGLQFDAEWRASRKEFAA